MEALAKEMTYFVTRAPQAEGQHFIHTEYCNVLPDRQALDEVGVFETCAEALAAAQDARDPVNACAMCAPDCHVPDRVGGAHRYDSRAAAEPAVERHDDDAT